MTPLFDTTITNIKLATHGRLEAMNAVLISSIAASAFNTQVEAWEPLIEPFDGIFKYIQFPLFSMCLFWFHFIIFQIFLPLLMLFCLTLLRFETYDTNVQQPSKIGKRIRVAATNILNMNVSAANLEAFVGCILSWRRQLELEQKAAKLNEVLILS